MRCEARDAVIRDVAAELGIAPHELVEALFADLPPERRVRAPPHPVAPADVAARANTALAQALLARSTAVEIEAVGCARALVRHARLRGLIGTVAPRGPRGRTVLALSGPFSLFRRTLLYGRALAELVPLLGWCERWRLRAGCVVGGRAVRLELASGDPIAPSAEPRRYDSRLEERFARDFRRAAPDWDVVREPEPVPAGGTLVFPDFELRHRSDEARRFLLEVVGFWTPGYVAAKLARYRDARLSNLVLCIDADRACGDDELPAGARVLRFRRRIDVREVLAMIT